MDSVFNFGFSRKKSKKRTKYDVILMYIPNCDSIIILRSMPLSNLKTCPKLYILQKQIVNAISLKAMERICSYEVHTKKMYIFTDKSAPIIFTDKSASIIFLGVKFLLRTHFIQTKYTCTIETVCHLISSKTYQQNFENLVSY